MGWPGTSIQQLRQGWRSSTTETFDTQSAVLGIHAGSDEGRMAKSSAAGLSLAAAGLGSSSSDSEDSGPRKPSAKRHRLSQGKPSHPLGSPSGPSAGKSQLPASKRLGRGAEEAEPDPRLPVRTPAEASVGAGTDAGGSDGGDDGAAEAWAVEDTDETTTEA
ncbi:unnamed protein product [Phytophthora lilii]|uniref:Unnamed protein product n=1 Tax=Phytophthora lilii TaxID=2077276 RepID=A0A9W6XNA1_9STRA|nr:unnamed protein product [Phytophthora lilii]